MGARVAAIAHPLRVAPVNDQPGLFEDLHVAGHAALACAEPRHQFAHAVLAATPDDRQGGAARRIADCGDHVLHHGVNISSQCAYAQENISNVRQAAAGLIRFEPRRGWRALHSRGTARLRAPRFHASNMSRRSRQPKRRESGRIGPSANNDHGKAMTSSNDLFAGSGDAPDPAPKQAPARPAPTPPRISRSSKGWSRCAAGPACISAGPTRRRCTICSRK